MIFLIFWLNLYLLSGYLIFIFWIKKLINIKEKNFFLLFYQNLNLCSNFLDGILYKEQTLRQNLVLNKSQHSIDIKMLMKLYLETWFAK